MSSLLRRSLHSSTNHPSSTRLVRDSGGHHKRWYSCTIAVALVLAIFVASLAIAPGANAEDGPGGATSTVGDETIADSEIELVTTELVGGSPELPFRDTTVTVYEPPCAEWSEPAVAPLSSEDAEQLAADEAAEEQALLDASTYEPRANELGGAKDYDAERPQVTTKAIKAPASRQAAFAQPPDTDAVFDLWDQIRADEEPSDDSSTTPAEPECLVYYWCGGERVDDVLFGGISDHPNGAYFEYVNWIGDILSAALTPFAPLVSYLIDREALAEGIAEGEFGDQPRADQMPVFYFCRLGEGGPLEITDPTYGPSFAWATTIEDEYDVEGARIDTTETLRTLLEGHLPQMQTIPPVEQGYTYVRLPMWLWIENIDDMGHFRIEAVSEEDTVRLATRATLTGFTWQVGDTTIPCAIEDMEPFIHGTNSITDPTPECSHMFTQLSEYTMMATAEYYVEEQVSYRGSDQFAWPDAPWTPHPTTPVVTISNETETMQVREIVSVNVPLDE